MLKTNLTLIFNDRIFDDGYVEPYIINVFTKSDYEKNYVYDRIEEAINMAENSDEGMQCSEEGIRQIFSYLNDIVDYYVIDKHDYSFEFGRGC